MVMATVCLPVSEVLCFLFNKFAKLNRTQLKSVLSGFYTENELCDARAMLFNDANKLNIDDLPRCPKRKGDNKVKLLVDDLIDLVTVLDEHKSFDQLPTYVAKDLDRVPLVKSDDLELYSMSRRLDDFSKQLGSLKCSDIKATSSVECIAGKLDSVCAELSRLSDSYRMTLDSLLKLDSMSSVAVGGSLASSNMYSMKVPPPSSDSVAVSDTNVQRGSAGGSVTFSYSSSVPSVSSESTTDEDVWNTVAVAVSDTDVQLDSAGGSNTSTNLSSVPSVSSESTTDDDGWNTVARRHSSQVRTPKLVRFRGAKATDSGSSVKALPRRPVVAAFVGRLHRDTTAEQLKTYLEAEGMCGVTCRKLTPKVGRHFRTSAFYVSCGLECKDVFYDCSRWPEGAELRDWVFK